MGEDSAVKKSDGGGGVDNNDEEEGEEEEYQNNLMQQASPLMNSTEQRDGDMTPNFSVRKQNYQDATRQRDEVSYPVREIFTNGDSRGDQKNDHGLIVPSPTTLAHLEEVEDGLRQVLRKRSESMDTNNLWSEQGSSSLPFLFSRTSSMDSECSDYGSGRGNSTSFDEEGSHFPQSMKSNRERTESSEVWYTRQISELRDATMQLHRMEDALRVAEARQGRFLFRNDRTCRRITDLKTSAASLRMELIKWKQELNSGATPLEVRTTMYAARADQSELEQRQVSRRVTDAALCTNCRYHLLQT